MFPCFFLYLFHLILQKHNSALIIKEFLKKNISACVCVYLRLMKERPPIKNNLNEQLKIYYAYRDQSNPILDHQSASQ